ncbi:MAG: phosphate signaling complex protein PhoU [Bacteroidota bacterium]|nr:phosphate signaling complex protein PhoU [Candidatus Kapabacteria bacterium]MDW8272268.1 phosphate signaling complex protein PhoU [Bacteroidota bacterium]
MHSPMDEARMYRQFEQDFDKLRTRLIRMGSLVEEQVEYAFRALLTGNTTLADLVIERDDKVDKLDLKIDKQVQRIFALSQPVARDLRLLLAAVKINNEFERIGDYAVIVARLAYDSAAHRIAELVGFERITKATCTMVKASLDAFIGNDPELAKHVLATDDIVDMLERELSTAIIGQMKADSSLVESGVRLIIGLHNIERIADRATNIAENVIFLAEAQLVRHQQVQGDVTPLQPEEPDESSREDERE